MPRWLLLLVTTTVFAAFFAGALAVQLGLSAVTPQIWALPSMAVVFALLLGLVPRLAPVEARFGPFLLYGTGLLLAFLYSNDLSRVSETTAKVLDLGLKGLWAVFGGSVLAVLVAACRRGGAAHAWVLAACGLGWLVAYFSGDAGGGGSWVDALVRRFGWDVATAEAAVAGLRKSLHFAFYGSFAGVGWMVARAGKAAAGPAAGVALGLAAMHAILDEARQLTTATRGGSGWDVLLDLAGALTFVAVAWVRSRSPR